MTARATNGGVRLLAKSGRLPVILLVLPKNTAGVSILMSKITLDSLLVSSGILSNGKQFINGIPLLNDTPSALKKTIIWNPEAKSVVPELGTLEPS